jgi:hypothetical protein
MAGRIDQGPGGEFERTGRGVVERVKQRRAKLASQTWPEFFRGFAVEVGAIALIVVIVAVVFTVLR